MKVEVRKEPPSRAVLEVEVPPEDLQRGLDRALAKLNQRYTVPGFRRGKAPKGLLERYVGKETVYEEAVNLIVPDAYAQAVDQAGVKPITRPQIKVDSVEQGKGLRFVATVDLVPEISLGDYRALRIAPEPAVVTDSDIEGAIADLRARHATLVSLGTAAAQLGDYVLVKIVEVSGKHDRFLPGKEYLVEVGGGAFSPEVERALIGAQGGATLTATSGDPPNSVTVEVLDVKRRELPALDDDFARTAADQPSVDALRETLRERMRKDAESRTAQAYEQKVIDALLEQSAIEVPQSLVAHEVQHLVADLTESLQRRGLTLQRYLDAREQTEQQLLDDLRPNAERRVRTQLAIEEVARVEHLEPSQEEIDREGENVARRLELDGARVRDWLAEAGRMEALTGALRRQKALTFLVETARGD